MTDKQMNETKAPEKATAICNLLKNYLGEHKFNATWEHVKESGQYETYQFLIFKNEDADNPEGKGCLLQAFLHRGEFNQIEVIEDCLRMISETDYFGKPLTPFPVVVTPIETTFNSETNEFVLKFDHGVNTKSDDLVCDETERVFYVVSISDDGRELIIMPYQDLEQNPPVYPITVIKR